MRKNSTQPNQLEIIHKELDLIENVITRMANNSFMLKGWAITIFVALITFFKLKNLSDLILIIALFSIIILFGYLDAFYLWMERKYTSLYSHVRKTRTENNNFDNLYDLNAEKYNNETVLDVIKNKKYQIKFIKDYIKKHLKESNFVLNKKNKNAIKIKAFWFSLKRNTIFIFYAIFLLFLLLYATYAFYNYKHNKETSSKSTYTITVNGANISISELDEKISYITTTLEQIDKNNNKNDTNIVKLQKEVYSINENIKELSRKISSIDDQFQKLQEKQNELLITINNSMDEAKKALQTE